MASLHCIRNKAGWSLIMGFWLQWTNAIGDSTAYPLNNATNNPKFGIGLTTAQNGPATQNPLINVTISSTLKTSLPTARVGPLIQTPLINVTNSSIPWTSLPTARIGPTMKTPYLFNMTNSSTMSAASTGFKNSSSVGNATTAVSTTSVGSTSIALATFANEEISLGQGFVPQSSATFSAIMVTPASNLGQGFVPPSTTITSAATIGNVKANLGQGALLQSTTTSLTTPSFATMEKIETTLRLGFVPQTNHDSEGTDLATSISHPVLDQSKSTSAPTEQQDDSQISSQPSYSGLGDAAPDTSPSPAQADLPLQNLAQPERTRPVSLPAITSAMAQQISEPPILVLGSQTLNLGGVITVDNTPISLPTQGSAIVVNGESRAIGSNPTAMTIGASILPIIPLASFQIPGSSSEALTIDGQRLMPGSAITIDNTPVSLPSTRSALVINGKTIPFGPIPTSITIGSQVIRVTPASPLPTALDFTPHVLTLDGQTLKAGDVVTIDNTPVSLLPTGSALVVDGKTVPISSTPTSITIGSQLFPITPAPQLPTALDFTPHALTLDGQALEPGSVITIDNTPVSLSPTGSDLIINGKTIPIGSAPTGITIGSQIVSVTPYTLGPVSTALVINGQTLQPGGNALTASNGVEVSLPASGTDVVLISGTSATTEVLGPAILSGLGIAPTGAAGSQASPGGSVVGLYSNSSAMAFTGGGERVMKMRSRGLWMWEATTMLGFLFGLWWL